MPLARDLSERFWSKVDRTGACWLWTSNTTRGGYGMFKIANRNRLAHRVAYELAIGAIPEGMTLDHLCRVRNCVNPAHLEPVTGRENTLRGDSPAAHHARQERCVNGHEFDGFTGGQRVCRQCRRLVSRRYRQRKAEA